MSWAVVYVPVLVPIEQTPPDAWMEQELTARIAMRKDKARLATGGNKEAFSKRITHLLKGLILGSECPRRQIDLCKIGSIWEFYAESFRCYGPAYKAEVCPNDRECQFDIYCRMRHEADPIFQLSLGSLGEVKEIQVIDFQSRNGKSYNELGKAHLASRKMFFQMNQWRERIQKNLEDGCRRHRSFALCTMHPPGKEAYRCEFSHSFETVLTRLILHTPDHAMTKKCAYELANCPFGASCRESHEDEPVRIGNFWFADTEEKKDD